MKTLKRKVTTGWIDAHYRADTLLTYLTVYDAYDTANVIYKTKRDALRYCESVRKIRITVEEI